MRKSIFLYSCFVFLIAWGAVTGCATREAPEPPVMPANDMTGSFSDAIFAKPPNAEGSLWRPTGHNFYVDKRAREVGDTVIVDIVENSTSALDANTETKRSGTTQYGIPSLMGAMKSVQAANPNFDPTSLISATSQNDFKGQAKSDRSGKITGSIGARVVEVLPGGNVMIHGSKYTTVNHETQIMTVSGIVRPQDIGADNRVSSTSLADARIVYSGSGVIDEKQKPGWASRVLDQIWPF